MLKKVLLAAVMSLILAGGAMIAAPAPADANHGCWKAAKAKYGGHWKERRAYRKHCHARYHHGKRGFLIFKKKA